MSQVEHTGKPQALEVGILGAGKGSRMQSDLPKVLHTVADRPLLEHVVNTAQQLDPLAIHVVLGHGGEQVKAALSNYDVNWVVQDRQLGTGHAVLQALPAISPHSARRFAMSWIRLIRIGPPPPSRRHGASSK